jgi:hypothetical protein
LDAGTKLAIDRKVEKTNQAQLGATAMLYEKKLTWRQYGELCKQIDDNLIDSEIARHQKFWQDFQRQDEEERRQREQQATEERRHRETVDAIKKSGSGGGIRTTTCNPIPGGAVHCSSY